MLRPSVLLVSAFFAASVPLSAQRPVLDYLGVLRSDGIAVPLFEWTGTEWLRAASPFPDGRRGILDIPYFQHMDSTGVAHRLRVGALVDLWDAYDDWGFLTDITPRDVSSRRVSYVVTDSASAAPFVVRREAGPDSLYLMSLIDSLAPIPDSVPSFLWSSLSWQGELGGQEWTFFEATRRGGGYPEPCYIVHGLRRADGSSEQLLQHGGDDCEGKGMGGRTPYALVRKGSSFFLLIEASGWESLTAELWGLAATGRWTRVVEGRTGGL